MTSRPVGRSTGHLVVHLDQVVWAIQVVKAVQVVQVVHHPHRVSNLVSIVRVGMMLEISMSHCDFLSRQQGRVNRPLLFCLSGVFFHRACWRIVMGTTFFPSRQGNMAFRSHCAGRVNRQCLQCFGGTGCSWGDFGSCACPMLTRYLIEICGSGAGDGI